MMTYRPDGGLTVRALDGPPDLDDLRAAVDGDHIELVPGFNTFPHGDDRVPCVAFCGEHGKLKQRPLNIRATILWERALRRGGTDLNGRDVLVGSVCVIYGDEELMEAL
jgi:hypothetical protein